jgi:Methyltransferase domain
MSGFSADWLALREPYDLRARNPLVLDAVAAHLEGRTSIRIVDLACGTGSTFRAVSPRLPARQRWTLTDYDPKLLARAAATPTAEDVAITVLPLDLDRDLDAALEGTVDLITTSALLDLVSDRWLQRLAAALAARAIPFYAALSYDGQVGFTPSDPFDGAIIDAVNQHQRTDKGFGPALGPEAAGAAVTCFEALGYSVMTGSSGWMIEPQDRDMQTELVDGWVSAAREIGTLSGEDIMAWSMRRRAMIAAGQSSQLVGHVDCFAVPSATR